MRIVQTANSAKALADMVTIHMGLTYRGSLKQANAGTVAAVQMKDVGAGVLESSHGLARLDAAEVPARYLLQDGDLVFRSRGFDNSFSRVASTLEAATTIAPMMFLRIRDQRRTLPEYLHWWLNRPAIHRLIDERAQGGTIRMIPASALESLPIDLPSARRQRAIVELAQLSRQAGQLLLQVEERRRVLLDSQLAALAKVSDE